VVRRRGRFPLGAVEAAGRIAENAVRSTAQTVLSAAGLGPGVAVSQAVAGWLIVGVGAAAATAVGRDG